MDAFDIASKFLDSGSQRNELELLILRHMERHIALATGHEREACAKFIEKTYRQDDEHEEALRARFVVKSSKTGYLEAWHQPSDVAAAIRNRTNLHDDDK